MFRLFLVRVLVLTLPQGSYGASFTGASPLLFFSLVVSPLSQVRVFILSLIFFSVLMFSVPYIGSYPQLVKYWRLKILFVFSMLVLILGSRPIAFIFGWDGLGVTRYLLVAYFSRWDSSNRAIVTILTNRLGDSFLLWFFVPFLCGTFNEESQMVNTPFVGLLLLTAITKSSQSPFSS